MRWWNNSTRGSLNRLYFSILPGCAASALNSPSKDLTPERRNGTVRAGLHIAK